MKQRFKLLTLALALMAGMTMTSCLNSESDPTVYVSPVVKVYTSYLGMGVYFETIDGQRIEPTEESYNASISKGINWNSLIGKVIQLQYSYNSESPDVEITDNGISGVTLIGYYDMNSAVEVVESAGAPNDSIGNMPIISIGEDNYGSVPIETQYWDTHTLLVPINYYIGNSFHNFTLEYRPYEENTTPGTVRLYLEHDKESDSPSQQMSSWNYMLGGYLYLYYRAFNLAPVENYLMMHGQSMPLTVTIVTREDDYSMELKDETSTKEYVVTYGSKEE